ncbi:hypothetical protein [Streptomyces sp. NPDC090112]|uniref:hypothetical protein n=1 Tax=Streptomyces sp. NPDC090112 TaxID=3365949 RepID=UPI00380E6767
MLRRTIGRRLGRSDRDDMLRALLWVSEVRMASDLAAGWRELHGTLERETTEAESRRDRLAWEDSDQVGRRTRAQAKKLADKLSDEQFEAQLALEECVRVVDKLAHRIGTEHQDDQQVQRVVLAVLNDQLKSANMRLGALLSEDRENLHKLAELEQLRRAGTGTALQQIDAMQLTEFRWFTQQALEREGFTCMQAGAQVLEVTRGGIKGIVFCDHIRQPPQDRMTDIEAVSTAQSLAAARGYDSVLMVSNLRFISQPAHRLSESRKPEIEMIQRFDLERWIEWGLPFNELEVWA